jgi:hypothetical protein
MKTLDREFLMALGTIALVAIASRQAFGQAASTKPDTLPFQILKWSPADQTAWINMALEKGMPNDMGGALNALAAAKSSLTLPLLEEKIEQVLHSKSPAECFTDKSVNPDKFVYLASMTIAYVGSQEAMSQVAKLIKLDEKRFGDLLDRTLLETENARAANPYILAYKSLELGDPQVEKRVYAWVQARLVDKDEYRLRDLRKFWAEAMVDRYGGVPTQGQWATDPFASKVDPSDEPTVRKDVIGYAIAVAEQRAKH